MADIASLVDPLPKLYQELSETITVEEEDKLRGLLRDRDNGIPVRELDQLKTPYDIFFALEKKGHITRNNLKFLKSLLKAINRNPLVEKVTQFEEKCAPEQRQFNETQEHKDLSEPIDMSTSHHQANIANIDSANITGEIQEAVPGLGQGFSNSTHHAANGYPAEIYIRSARDRSLASGISAAVRREIAQLQSGDSSVHDIREILREREYTALSSGDGTQLQEDVVSIVSESGKVIVEDYQIPRDRSIIVTEGGSVVLSERGKLWRDDDGNFHL
ncbi:uncharacterized protein [Ptychodera flava]|uniref:uncharacterized protein n=1 Tax=Ptychodera flava TaxID=63121 RepID=UPI003969C611